MLIAAMPVTTITRALETCDFIEGITRERLTSGSPTGLQESAPPYLQQNWRGIPGIRRKGRETVLVLAP